MWMFPSRRMKQGGNADSAGSLLVEEGKKYVFVYHEAEETVTKKEVETGLVSDTMYQITSGVSAGEQLSRTPPKPWQMVHA